MRKPVRLKDIARELGVSPGLVSAVLNSKNSPWVSEQTRQRILETAKSMGYRPQAAARTLRSGKTYTVALLYWQHEYVRIEGLAQALAEAGYHLNVYVLGSETEFENTLHSIVRSRTADSIVLWGGEQRMEQFGEYLQHEGIRFAVKGRHERCHPTWCQIDFDHEGMMHTSVNHLMNIGHRRIAYLGYPLTETYRHHLLDGYRQAVTDRTGSPPPEHLIACCVNSVEDAEECVHQWLSLPIHQQPTAIVVTADNEGWYGVERALAKHGKFIGEEPGDFGVSGQCQPALRLAFGHAHAHIHIDLNVLGAILANAIVLPLMNGTEPESRIIRILPEMAPVETQALRHLMGSQPNTPHTT